jgi:hypothetical protein
LAGAAGAGALPAGASFFSQAVNVASVRATTPSRTVIRFDIAPPW